jgi:multimeric flavodoxin WrbA
MKIVAINGSGTGVSGVTGQSLENVVDGAREAGAEVETFLLTKLNISPCRGCRTCQRKGHCVIDDDFPTIQKAMIGADGMVLASPNYISNVSGQVKCLLDRSFSLMFHCQGMHRKYAAVVVASGGPLFEDVEKYLLRVAGNMGCWKVGSLVVAGDQLADPEERTAVFNEGKELGKNLAEAIKTKQVFPEQQEDREMTFEMMRWLVANNKEKWPHEYAYWHKHWPDNA